MPLFHEKQRYMRCGIHAINNLLQRKEFDVASFDAICRELSPESSWQHQSILGLGNYNVDILTMALMKQVHAGGFTLSYFDKRKPLALLDLQATTGILCNAASVSLMGLWHSRHWFAIRSIYGVYYNLDSKLPEPKVRLPS
ncbi:hypothetical protein Ae201684_014319 [Aphanomyces euteiches]|uniref:ubiquitinyl hydrolase 1 n=1 Tax=Aphanomyces euteiches TaxID=100861 RepID=A0A6G0WKB6_9STRA|nr:hypothetical protein Ae201684_014319 [Aphanomyces euteiches]KAH9136767.1 hypothetical protein AeRB84_018241 [Aphanomyces euteiches]